MITALESSQSELVSIVGAAGVVTDEAVCRGFSVDGIIPKSVVYPKNPEEVAAVLKCAADRGLGVIPCRNGTKLGIGNAPKRYDIALSLKDLNNVWHYEPADLTASAEAGLKFGDFQELLARHGLWLPLDPAGGARASVGGILASNATGALRLLFGTPRDMVLGMKIATTEGKIIRTGGRVVKNVAGYDLTKLFLGSYGTLGVILEANFKLFPLPAERATFAFQVPTLDVARDLRRRIVDSPLTPMRVVLMNASAETFAVEHQSGSSYVMWVEAGGTPRVLDRYSRALDEMGKSANIPISTIDEGRALAAWSRIADFGAAVSANYPGCVSMRASLPMSSCEECVRQAEQEAERAHTKMAFVALTAAGVVHLHLMERDDVNVITTAIHNLRAAIQTLRGALVVERSSPEVKAQVDVWGAPGDDLEMMRGIKQAWDPKGILAPGRFLSRL